MSIEYSASISIATLSQNFKSINGGESLTIDNVPSDKCSSVKLNFTLSGFIQVQIDGNKVIGKKPDVSIF
jgi:hypothetical protein